MRVLLALVALFIFAGPLAAQRCESPIQTDSPPTQNHEIVVVSPSGNGFEMLRSRSAAEPIQFPYWPDEEVWGFYGILASERRSGAVSLRISRYYRVGQEALYGVVKVERSVGFYRDGRAVDPLAATQRPGHDPGPP